MDPVLRLFHRRRSPLHRARRGHEQGEGPHLRAYAYPGGFVWVVCFVSIGYYLGAEWEKLSHRFNRGAIIVAAAIVAIAVAGWFLRRRNRIV